MDRVNQELNPRLDELESIIQKEEELKKKIAEEIELRYKLQVENLVHEKKELEQKLYKAIECENISYEKLDKARIINSKILKSKNEVLNLSVLGFLKAKKEHKKQMKQMQERDVNYWAPVFDAEYYAKTYEDVRNALGTGEDALLDHFLQYGVYEGRSGTKMFNASRYVDLNKDVAEFYFGDNLAASVHYIENGQFEKRNI